MLRRAATRIGGRTKVIIAAHTVIFAHDAERARAFFRDVLDLPNVDAHDGWLIFKLPPAEVAFHPESGDGVPSGRHELYLMCDDIEQTVADLKAKGAEFASPVTQAGFGLVTSIKIPGGGEIGLYEPRHRTAYEL
jgi:catechol 2,3-dioxygenase-like lactoylglutathione lyase family enzyme